MSLALEYAGKATLLYKHHYGEDHEETKKSYKLFTSIYAEAGKEEYSNSLEHARMELPVRSLLNYLKSITNYYWSFGLELGKKLTIM